MTAHLALTEDGRDLHRGEFRQQCSCGWQAPGWHRCRSSAGQLWREHVRESDQERETGQSDER